MKRVYAGADASLTFTVTTGGTLSATVLDTQGRKITASVSETGGTATLTIASGNWTSGKPGFGRIEIKRDNAGSKSIEVSERFRILPSISLSRTNDYAA